MKQLTKEEITFIKETGWTPTVYQCSEWDRTIWTTEHLSIEPMDTYIDRRDTYSNKYYNIAYNEAKKYGFDLDELYKKFTTECDGISLEYEATYLFYLFFTKEELEQLTDEKATKWLKDFQYFYGYRKWNGDNLRFVEEALQIYKNNRVFYLENDNEVWNISKDEYPDSWVWKHPEVILKNDIC